MDEARIAAFVEYVIRPLSEDWRQILEKLQALNITLSEATVRQAALGFSLWHLAGEVIRGGTYVAVTWIVCHTIRALW